MRRIPSVVLFLPLVMTVSLVLLSCTRQADGPAPDKLPPATP
jgi:hypothetical protein